MTSPASDTALAAALRQAAADASFRATLLRDPRTALGALGLALPEGMTLRVAENSAETVNLPLPPPPRPGESWDEALARLARDTPSGDTVQLVLSLLIVHLVRFARAWSDPAFRDRLVLDPDAAMAALDGEIAASVHLKVLEDTEELVHLVLPPAGSGSVAV
jgi:hypothetical protein